MTLIDQLLDDAQSLTAVERFSRHHDAMESRARSGDYRDLIPIHAPEKGMQYAFAVNLDRCTGCKACVSACHSLNGLDDHESWRDTGLLVGTSTAYQQTVTTACHHCVDPACLLGCPVRAYEKDAETGIVRHLDDQCIGCQYCVMKCPYEVPKYSKRLGIVRKCDMCHGRLALGEAPACVQACPHEAIRIEVVNPDEIPTTGSLLPGCVDNAYTRPTTRYFGRSPVPADARPSRESELEHPHWALIIMLVATQAAVGMFVGMAAGAGGFAAAAVASGILFAGLGASVFHLGRPFGAWRFFLGLGTSWMSREILAFGLLAGAAGLSTAALFLLQWNLFAVPAVFGLVAVFTSVMIYADTRRQDWSLPGTATKFFQTTAILGAAGIAVFEPRAIALAIITTLVAGLWEAANRIPRGLSERSRRVDLARLAIGLVALGLWSAQLAIPAFVLAIAGAIFERYTFFRFVTPWRMPGHQ